MGREIVYTTTSRKRSLRLQTVLDVGSHALNTGCLCCKFERRAQHCTRHVAE